MIVVRVTPLLSNLSTGHRCGYQRPAHRRCGCRAPGRAEPLPRRWRLRGLLLWREGFARCDISRRGGSGLCLRHTARSTARLQDCTELLAAAAACRPGTRAGPQSTGLAIGSRAILEAAIANQVRASPCCAEQRCCCAAESSNTSLFSSLSRNVVSVSSRS